MQVDMTLSVASGRRTKKVWSGATAGCSVSLGVREALEAILQINAQTMKSLGYPKQPLAKFVTASLEMTNRCISGF